jgi:tetratricopeptide (TPR) repeat protein
MTQQRAFGSGDKGGDQSAADLLAAAALFAEGLADGAATALRLAAESHAFDEIAERHLAVASQIMPDHAAVLIGHYRYYFYKGRLAEALGVACRCLVKAAQDNGLPADWHQVRTDDADFGSYDAVLPRFYMFTLKAYAYLQLRLGDYGEGRDAALKLLELDPTDKVNARLLLDVLQRAGLDDV